MQSVEARPSALRRAKRITVAIVGGTILLAGVVLIALPGPASLVIPAGLGVLATEFAWAERCLGRVRRLAGRLKAGLGRRSLSR